MSDLGSVFLSVKQDVTERRCLRKIAIYNHKSPFANLKVLSERPALEDPFAASRTVIVQLASMSARNMAFF